MLKRRLFQSFLCCWIAGSFIWCAAIVWPEKSTFAFTTAATCQKCAKNGTHTCPGRPAFNCFGATPICSDCSSGCPTLVLPKMQCATAASGSLNCTAVITFCNNLVTETVQPCNFACVCSLWQSFAFGCPGGSFQSGCKLTGTCPAPAAANNFNNGLGDVQSSIDVGP